jgi:Rieske 2Fe-2S family protein
VNQQDFDACERCQPTMNSRVYRNGGVLVPSEHHIGLFHDWLQGQLGTAATGRSTGPDRQLGTGGPCGV